VGFLVLEVEGHWRTSRQCHPSRVVKNFLVGILVPAGERKGSPAVVGIRFR
jgi:hypothetical protein